MAAYIYKWVVAVGIIFFFYTFLKPYKLEIIGVMLAWGAITAAEHGLQGSGALGPVQAFGLEGLTRGATSAGLEQV